MEAFPYRGTPLLALLCTLVWSAESVYELGPSNMTHVAAKLHCASIGSVLYTQTELGQWGDLKSQVTFRENSTFWIGLFRESVSSPFLWSDYTAFSTTYWLPNEPNNSTDHNCVQARELDGHWATMTCDVLSEFVCQPAPPTTYIPLTPRPRPAIKRDGNAIMIEGLIKGFACAGGLILAVALLVNLPCCRTWVKKTDERIARWNQEMRGKKVVATMSEQ